MSNKKILIVDDEVDFTRLLKSNLEETGKFEVLALPNANDIISQVHAFKPDIILLDIIMPGTKGIEVCEMLNKDVVGKAIPIIIISALAKDADKYKAYRVGVVDYMEKPIEIERLIVKIDKYIQFKQGAES
ncbi:MAG: response regulator [Candidatus Omnitrophica bacterium]|jgi:two-component system phosphate regulon response regulator PhoB|nr:response regulator [Candidatus Omnitrophota bacterium]MDD5691459.1 response regulator [Candidatus Omnitrophota bacterium]